MSRELGDDPVISLPQFSEVATFIIALIVVCGCFYGLLSTDTDEDARVIYGGLLGSVATFYFTQQATKISARHTLEVIDRKVKNRQEKE